MNKYQFSSLALVNQSAIDCSAEIRHQPEHFLVEEVLPFEPEGEGGHVWLKIQKKAINTDWLANQLAKYAGVKPVAVGYAGLKDRHAITEQWFSVNLEGIEEPDWSAFENENIVILERTRHRKKLKRGVLAGNKFKLRLINIKGDRSRWLENLRQVQQTGVPNYFGEQRFGHQMKNLEQVDAWFTTGKAPRKRHQKSLYLSAARSWLFNLILSERVEQQNWNKALAGDLMVLSGTKASLFSAEDVNEVLESRLSTMDVHPTGALWGKGQLKNTAASLLLEQQVLSNWSLWQKGLENSGLQQERRALRLFSSDFNWQFEDNNDLELSFFLPAGCYATAVLRELAICRNLQQRNY